MTTADPAPLVTDDDVAALCRTRHGDDWTDMHAFIVNARAGEARRDLLAVAPAMRDRWLTEFHASVTGYEAGGMTFAPEDVTLIRVQEVDKT